LEKKKNPIAFISSFIVENITWDFISYAISFLASPFLSKWRKIIMGGFEFSYFATLLIYFVIVYGALQIATDIFNALFDTKWEGIAKARKSGVRLRNHGKRIISAMDSLQWNIEFNEWIKLTCKKIKRISRSDAVFFETIDDFYERGFVLKGFDPVQTNNLNVLNEMLSRLDKYYRRKKLD